MQARRIQLTQEQLKELLDYSPASGEFTWKKNTGKRRQVGVVAGSVAHVRGYRLITINDKTLPTHTWPRRSCCIRSRTLTGSQFEGVGLIKTRESGLFRVERT